MCDFYPMKKQLVKRFSVRYGRTYKVVLAIILPPVVFIPLFILVMQLFRPMAEWQVWTSIVIFFGGMIWLSVWLALRLYPRTILGINQDEISLQFDQTNLIAPRDFTFRVADVTSFTRGEIRGAEYYVICTQNPARKFQVSSSSYEWKEMMAFYEAMVEISELVRQE